MPIYPYRCQCGHTKEMYRPMRDHDMETICTKCGAHMTKDFGQLRQAYHDVPFDSVDYDLTGEPIYFSTRGQLKRIAKEHGCTVNFGASNRAHNFLGGKDNRR